jgi:tetratricopeptide (TPR) repeat protein
MNDTNDKTKSPPSRDPGGPRGGFGARGGSDGKGRGGRDGDRKGSFGQRKEGAGGGAAYRVVNELSALEKALAKSDFPSMREPLKQIHKSLAPMRLSSLDALEIGARGKLITSLMRVARLPKPTEPVAAPVVVPESTPAPEAEMANPEGTSTEPVTAPEPKVSESPVTGWTDTMFSIGLIWSSVGERDRAEKAFESSGRQPSASDLALPPPVENKARTDGFTKAPRGAKPERKGRDEKRAPRPVFQPRAPVLTSGDWQLDARNYEEAGRTRDAGRVHEKNKSYTAAARLYEIGGDFKAAYRNAILADNKESAAAFALKLKPEEIIDGLERAQAWEQLMAFHAERKDFDSVAKLYEKARQFDQAAIAWERAGKLSLARKAFERAGDTGAVSRLKEAETSKLIERGDRFGAATLFMSTGKRAEALETLKPLPPAKAFHFMQKLKLNDEATALGKEEMAKAEAAGLLLIKARWLELLGEPAAAIALYLEQGRKDKAAWVYDATGEFAKAAVLLEESGQLDKAQSLFVKAGDLVNAERVKGIPRPTAPVVESSPPAPSEI